MRQAKRTATVVLFAVVALCLAEKAAVGQSAKANADYPVYVTLIKNALTAVNHGNITGNYTVLRDLASERFRQRNKAADLAITFGDLRQKKMDLSPILSLEPQLTQRPVADTSGRLQLVGYFPTRPLAVHFGLIFQRVEAGWMIDEISIQVSPPQQQAQPWGS